VTRSHRQKKTAPVGAAFLKKDGVGKSNRSREPAMLANRRPICCNKHITRDFKCEIVFSDGRKSVIGFSDRRYENCIVLISSSLLSHWNFAIIQRKNPFPEELHETDPFIRPAHRQAGQ
jgi:hypothetical protein